MLNCVNKNGDKKCFFYKNGECAFYYDYCYWADLIGEKPKDIYIKEKIADEMNKYLSKKYGKYDDIKPLIKK